MCLIIMNRSFILFFSIIVMHLSSKGQQAPHVIPPTFDVSDPSNREAYGEYLENHPFSKRPHLTKNEFKEIPKADRPDLAWEQDFLRTMDPALGRPAPERLGPIYELVEQYNNSSLQLPPGTSTTPWQERGPYNVAGRTRAMVFDVNDTTHKKVWAGGVTGGLWYNNDITDATSQWISVGDFWDNMSITAIAYDPNNSQTMYVGTGEGWGVKSGRGMGIWKSTDGGTTFSHLPNTANFAYINDLVVRNNGGNSEIYIGVSRYSYQGLTAGQTNEDGLYVSFNGGFSFNRLTLSTGDLNAAGDIEIGANNRIWVATLSSNSNSTVSGSIYYSDNGTNWILSYNTTVPNSLTTVSRIELACAPSDSNIVYGILNSTFFTNIDFISAIVKTTNGGDTWISSSSSSTLSEPIDADTNIPSTDFARRQGRYNLICAVDPSNANVLMVGGINLFRSTNGGQSWSQISKWSNNNNLATLPCPHVHSDQHAIVYRPGNVNQAIIGNDGGVYFASNLAIAADSSWAIEPRNLYYNVTQFYSCAMNGTAGNNTFLAGSQDNGTQKFSSPGMNFTSEVFGGDGGFCFINNLDSNIAISSVYYNNFFYSTDGGNTFPTQILSDPYSGYFINPADYDENQNVLYTARYNGNLYMVTNLGSNPMANTFLVNGMTTMATSIKVSPFSAVLSNLYIGSANGDLFKWIASLNGSQGSIVNIGSTNFPNGSISSIEFGANENQIIVTFFNYGVNNVWYTSDGGVTWSSKEGNLPDMPVRWGLLNPTNLNEAILATEVGVWSTSNFLASSPVWVPSNSGLANVRVDMLQLRNSDYKILAATHGRGLFSGQFTQFAHQVSANLNSNDVSCNSTFCDGSAAIVPVDAIGNPSILWSTGDTTSTINNLCVGTYSVTVTDSSSSWNGSITIGLAPQITNIQQVSACNSYTWPTNNQTYIYSGQYFQTYVSASGCDSTIELALTIHTSDTTIDQRNACNNLTWIDGNTYYASTSSPFLVYTNSFGCDSVVKLDLSILPDSVVFSYQNPAFCLNDPNTQISVNSIATAPGNYWASPGLQIDPNTGSINLQASNAGNFVVNYSPLASYVATNVIDTIDDRLLGQTMAMNSAGDIIAATLTLGTKGYVRVYKKVGGNWQPLGPDITAPNNFTGVFGFSLAMNSAGNRIAIGQTTNQVFYNGNQSNYGRVLVYEWNGLTWTQIGNVINGIGSESKCGLEVDLDASGNTLVVSSYKHNAQQKRYVDVYQYTNSTWVQKGSTIFGDNLTDGFGETITINAQGDRIGIGSLRSNENGQLSGKVQVYTWNGVNWYQLGPTLLGSPFSEFGTSIDFNYSGSRIVVGAPQMNGKGEVKVFSYASGVWNMVGNAIEGQVYGQNCGMKVKIDSIGNLLAIGTTYDQLTFNGPTPKITTHLLQNNVWNQFGTDIPFYNNASTANSSIVTDNKLSTIATGRISNPAGVSGTIGIIFFAADYGFAGYCPAPQSINLVQPSPISIGNDTSICLNGTFTVGTSTPFNSYAWSTNDTAQSILVNSAGLYSVTVTDNNGCSVSDSILISTGSTPITVSADTLVCANTPVTLSATTNGTVFWSTSSTSPTIQVSPLVPTQYVVVASDTSGCLYPTLKTIFVDVKPTISPFDYNGITSICPSDTTLVANLNVEEGGFFISQAGLRVDTLSGNINIGESLPGSYAVNYYDFTKLSTPLTSSTSQWFGSSTALNSDGTVLATRSQYSGVKVFTRTDTLWNQLGAELTTVNSDRFGYSVDINHSGQTLIVGAPQEGTNTFTPGYAAVFDWVNNQWQPRIPYIIGDVGSYAFGHSVRLNAAGNIAAISSYSRLNTTQNTPDGYVKVFEWTGNGWQQLGATLTIPGEYSFGYSIDLNDAGDKIIIGSPEKQLNYGSVRIYHWDGSAWNMAGSEITDNYSKKLGFDVAMNGSGNVVAFGAYQSPYVIAYEFYYSNYGYVKVMEWNGNEYVQKGNALGGNAQLLNYGKYIELSSSGDTLVTMPSSLRADVFSWESGHWRKIKSALENGTSTASLSMSKDGKVFTVSNPGIAIGGLTYPIFTYTAVNPFSCYAPTNITILQPPAFDFPEDTSICFGNAFTLDPNITGVSYLWSDGSTGQTLTPTASGFFTLQTTDSIGCTFDDYIAVGIDTIATGFDYGADTIICQTDVPVAPQITSSVNQSIYCIANPIGLDINSQNGTIVPDSSLPGNYQINSFQGYNAVQFGPTIYNTSIQRFANLLVTNQDGSVILSSSQIANDARVQAYKFNGFSYEKLGFELLEYANVNTFGILIAINKKGDRIAVGDQTIQNSSNSRSKVKIYHLVNNNWTPLGNSINGNSAGFTLSNSKLLNGNGDHVIIQTLTSSTNGSVDKTLVYYWTGVNWERKDTLEFPNNSNYRYCINDAGNRIAYFNNKFGTSNFANIEVYEYNGAKYVPAGPPIFIDTTKVISTSTIDFSDGGNKIAIGYKTVDSSFFEAYELVNGNWQKIGNTFTALSGNTFTSVQLSDNGNKAVIIGTLPIDSGRWIGQYDLKNATWVNTKNDFLGNSYFTSTAIYGISLCSDLSKVACGLSRYSGNNGKIEVYSLFDETECSPPTNITVLPAVPIHLGADTVLCTSNLPTIDAGSGYANYLWSTGDTTSTLLVPNSGIYSVTATAANGCLSIDTIVYDSLKTRVNVGACGEYTWSLTNQTYTSSGIYNATVYTANNCDSVVTLNLVIHTLPEQVLDAEYLVCNSQLATLVADSGVGYTYEWSNTNLNQSLLIDTSNAGVYYVTVTTPEGCSIVDSTTVIAGPCASVEEFTTSTFIKAYPNPTSGAVTVEYINQTKEDLQVKVYNELGSLLIDQVLPFSERGTATLDLSRYANGLYLIQVSNTQFNAIKRINLVR